jgi:hypothetical protein
VSQEQTPPETEPLPSGEDADPTPDPAAATEASEAIEDLNSNHLPKPKLKELIRSSDPPSRYLTWLSITFGFLAVVCYGLLIYRYIEHRNANRDLQAEEAERARLYGGWLNKQLAFNRPRPGEDPVFMQDLGQFRVMWARSELRVRITAECTNEETCNELKNRPEEISDLVLPVLQASSPEEVLNPNSKLELRRLLAEKLNALKFSGKIMMVDFTDLTVEPVSASEKP